jgi:hypothetical protein
MAKAGKEGVGSGGVWWRAHMDALGFPGGVGGLVGRHGAELLALMLERRMRRCQNVGKPCRVLETSTFKTVGW